MAEDKTNPAWRELEREVAGIYRALGFKVQEDVLLEGRQIDVLAERSMGGPNSYLLSVEVKLRSRGSVPLSEVDKFISTASALLSTGTIDGAALVSNVPITPKGRLALFADRRLSASTVDDLRKGLIYREEAIRFTIREYQNRKIAGRYLDVAIAPFDDSDESLCQHYMINPIAVSDLLNAADTVAGKAGIAIMGDYGSGKTTALERIRIEALERFLEGRSNRLPILFKLQTLLDFRDLPSFISAAASTDLGGDGDVGPLLERLKSGHLLALLDGFDEISVQPRADQRAEYMQRIAPLLFSKSPAILTTRPSYFVNLKEYRSAVRRAYEARGLLTSKNPRRKIISETGRSLVDSLRHELHQGQLHALSEDCIALTLLPLDAERILAYLEAQNQEFSAKGIRDPAEVLQFLDRVYDLSDLVTRPILLEMVVETILDGAIDIYDESQTLTAAELYEIYTELRLLYDVDKGPRRVKGLGPLKRREYAEFLAWEMNRRGIQEISDEDARKIIPRVMSSRQLEGRDHAEQFMTELRTCSFMTTSHDGGLRFVHKSFLEYFVACRVREAIDEDDFIGNRQVETGYPNEVAYFLGSMAVQAEFRATLLNVWREIKRRHNETTSIASLTISSLLYADESISGEDLDGFVSLQVRRRRLSLRNCSVNRGLLRHSTSVLELEQCTGTGLVVEGAGNELLLRESKLSLRFAGSVGILDVDSSNAQLDVTTSDNASITAKNRALASLLLRGSSHVTLECVESLVHVSGALPSRISARDGIVVLHANDIDAGEVDLDLDRCLLVVATAGLSPPEHIAFRGTVRGSVVLASVLMPITPLIDLLMPMSTLFGGDIPWAIAEQGRLAPDQRRLIRVSEQMLKWSSRTNGVVTTDKPLEERIDPGRAMGLFAFARKSRPGGPDTSFAAALEKILEDFRREWDPVASRAGTVIDVEPLQQEIRILGTQLNSRDLEEADKVLDKLAPLARYSSRSGSSRGVQDHLRFTARR